MADQLLKEGTGREKSPDNYLATEGKKGPQQDQQVHYQKDAVVIQAEEVFGSLARM